MQIKYYDNTQAKKYLYFLLNTHKFLLTNVQKVKYIFFSASTDLRENAHFLQNVYI